MRGMKKKGRGREEAKKNIIKKSLSVAILVSSVLIASMPLAAADITSFTITPCRSLPGEVFDKPGYTVNMTIDATGFTSLDMVIPAGFEAKAPGGGELLAEAWLLDNESHDYYLKFTANGTDKIDLYCECGGDKVNYTFDASYGEGDSINISVSCHGSVYANLTLPKSTVNGSLKMSLQGASKKLKHVNISIKEFVRNPAASGRYTFDVTANGDTDSYPVCIMYPGDINGDCEVDVGDLQLLAWAWGSHPGDTNWNPCADLNCDGKISVADLQIMAWNFLKKYPC